MTQDAGFAAALTVRERVLSVALNSAYANGSFPTGLADAVLLGGPPAVEASELFLGQPSVNCEGTTGLLVLIVPAWGPLLVTVDGTGHTVDINGEIEVTLAPKFTPGSSLQLELLDEDVVVRRWSVAVLSTGTPPDVVAYVASDDFRQRLQKTLRTAVALRRIELPSVDAAFLGPVAQMATAVRGRVVNGALLLGLDVDTDDVTIVGELADLQAFALGNDVAGVVSSSATDLFLDQVHEKLVKAVDDEGATLDRFTVVPMSGYFEVSGAVSKSSGTVNFSFHIVPSTFHTRAGTTFTYLRKPRWTRTRTWAALGFQVDSVDTDVDRAWWVVLFGEVIGGILTAGLATIYVEDLVAATAHSFSSRIIAASPGAPAARIRTTVPPPGGVRVRIGVDQFDITHQGTYVGISVRESPTSAALLGPKVLPATYATEPVRFLLRLPSGAFAHDPALRIRWTVEDRTTAVVVVDQDDDFIAQRRHLDIVPAVFPTAADFGVTVRLYRRLGVNVTELASETLDMHLRGALPTGAYTRWRSVVKNPQITVDEATDTWTYHGEREVRRWSEWHRTDAPCLAVHASATYRFDDETIDKLPFPIRLLESHRKGLCPYCFYGGPAGTNPEL